MDLMLLAVIGAALFFDFTNGWHDTANAIATVVSTRVLAPMTAVLFAAVLNFAGAFASDKVAKTIGTGLIDADQVTLNVLLAAMLAAGLWMTITVLIGLPISGSHSLIGSLIGAAITNSGFDAVHWGGITKVVIWMVVSPLMGFTIGYFFLVAVYWIAYVLSRETVRRTFNTLQIFSSGFVAFTHGMGDAQKTMGVITLALYVGGKQQTMDIHLWVMFVCATMMGLGTAAGGWNVIKTLGMRLAHIRPIEGFAAEAATGLTLSLAAYVGAPVSSTQTITGAILGVGTASRAKAVKWGLGQKIVYAWLLTIPATAVLGGVLSLLTRLLPGPTH